MKKFLYYAGQNKKYIYLSAVCLCVSTLAGVVPYFLLNEIIVGLLTNSIVWKTSLILLGIIIFALVLKSLLYGLGLKLSHTGAYNTLLNLRKHFSSSMVKQPMGYIMKEGTGKYKKTFVEDISELENTLAHIIPEGVPYAVGVLATLIAIFVTDWRIGLASLIMIPISMSPMMFMMKANLEKMPKYYESRDKLNHNLVEYVSGMEVIKIFNKTNKSYDKLEKSIYETRDFTLDWYRESWKSTAVINALLPCTLLLPLPLAIYFFVNETLVLSEFTLLVMLGLGLGEPLMKLANYIPAIPMLNYNLEKIEKIFIHENVTSGDYEDAPNNFDVEFTDVHFSYDEGEVIKGINLKIPQNTICALVGSSGGGKSTLAKLLMHFWDVDKGSIKIGGKDISEYSFDNLMRHISYVSQENTLLHGTVFENIAIAKENITKEEVIKVCKRANCHDFIMELENGYDTDVGTLGSKLSGGERQRISIARAMVKNADIVVLDEATAFADAENEYLIQKALTNLLEGKTILIIAHKLHTIKEADKIVVIKDGIIESEGRHAELLDASPTYKLLWQQNQKSVNWDLGGERDV